MIGSFIPESDDHYRNYLLILEITDYLMAPEISEDDVSYLKLLIEDHHTASFDLYPQSNVIPKMDALLYYITHAKAFFMWVCMYMQQVSKYHHYHKVLTTV